MAKLVLAAGVPHPPRLVFEMQQAPGKVKGEALMKQVREQVEKAEPDVIIEVDSDHFVNFFYNNLPSFCIGMAEEAQGPQEDWCPMPRYTVRGHVPLAKALFKYGVNDKFDLAAAHELRLDHSLTVPLHFLNPGMRLPVVPIYTNGFASPLPLATRCVALGRMVRRFIDAWEGKERIALIASGCFAMTKCVFAVGKDLLASGAVLARWTFSKANCLAFKETRIYPPRTGMRKVC